MKAKEGMHIITITHIENLWDMREKGIIIKKDRYAYLVYFPKQECSWWLESKNFIVDKTYFSKATVVVCKKYAKDATQKHYLGKKVKVLYHSGNNYVCKCHDGNILTFARRELKVEKKKVKSNG